MCTKKGCARTRARLFRAPASRFVDYLVAAFSFSFAERPPFTSQECILPAKTQI
jgi:hypothetical protein